MSVTCQAIGRAIEISKSEVAILIVDEHWKLRPEFTARYGETGHTKCVQDVTYNLSYLSQAIIAESPPLFETYLEWVKSLFAGLNIPTSELTESLTIARDIFDRRLPPEDSKIVAEYLDAGLKCLAKPPVGTPSFFVDEHPLSDFARKYLAELRGENRPAANAMILDAVAQGTSVKDIYLNVFQPSQYEIGRLWQLNEMTVAEEHYCTAATQLIMAQLYPYTFASKKNGLRLLAVCIGDELHEIGLHMVADLFEMEGWDTYYLGSNTPAAVVLQTLDARRPNVLAISATMTYHVELVGGLIAKVREANLDTIPQIIVGGYPFNVDPKLWQHVGADGYARDAEQAVAEGNRLTQSTSEHE